MADSSVAKILTINLVLLRVNVNFYWGSDGRASGLCSYTIIASSITLPVETAGYTSLLRSLINGMHGLLSIPE